MLERLGMAVLAVFRTLRLVQSVKGALRANACPANRMLWVLIIIITYAGAGSAAPSGSELLAALRLGNITEAQHLIKHGAPVNAVDDAGSSALMYAAIYSDLATMRLLLAKGADPNHADQAGSTALMWSIPDAAKVRLLVARGANVNAVSSLTGGTP